MTNLLLVPVILFTFNLSLSQDLIPTKSFTLENGVAKKLNN